MPFGFSTFHTHTLAQEAKEDGLSIRLMLYYLVVVVVAFNVCSAAGAMFHLTLYASLWVLESVCALCNCN